MNMHELEGFLAQAVTEGTVLTAVLKDDGEWSDATRRLLGLHATHRITLQSTSLTILEAIRIHGKPGNRWLALTDAGARANRTIELTFNDLHGVHGFADFCSNHIETLSESAPAPASRSRTSRREMSPTTS